MIRKPWTEWELTVLRECYPDSRTEDIAIALGRQARAVYSKATSMGLSKTAEYLASPAAGRLDGKRGAGNRFASGHTTWNKGAHFNAGGRSVETRFKKGNMSGAAQHNYVPVGTTRISKDGYLERKTNDDHPVPARRWISVHRLVWEAAHGPIPPKHVVVFKAGMRTNIEEEITVDRLECISQAENMRRNTLHRYPKEIVDAIRWRAVLNRRINREQEEHQ